MDIETQREIFARAVDALGGYRSAARALAVNEKSVIRWIKGERRLHDGILEKMCRVLIAHADLCKGLERQLHPGFAGNRTPGQERPPQHAGPQARTPVETAAIEGAKRRLGLVGVDAAHDTAADRKD
jgi:hypothetical protein